MKGIVERIMTFELTKKQEIIAAIVVVAIVFAFIPLGYVIAVALGACCIIGVIILVIIALFIGKKR